MNVDNLLAVISGILTDRYNVQITAKAERNEGNAINAAVQHPRSVAESQARDNRSK
jgi:hypothetical protein